MKQNNIQNKGITALRSRSEENEKRTGNLSYIALFACSKLIV